MSFSARFSVTAVNEKVSPRASLSRISRMPRLYARIGIHGGAKKGKCAWNRRNRFLTARAGAESSVSGDSRRLVKLVENPPGFTTPSSLIALARASAPGEFRLNEIRSIGSWPGVLSFPVYGATRKVLFPAARSIRARVSYRIVSLRQVRGFKRVFWQITMRTIGEYVTPGEFSGGRASCNGVDLRQRRRRRCRRQRRQREFRITSLARFTCVSDGLPGS